jgi:hypothetical protein
VIVGFSGNSQVSFQFLSRPQLRTQLLVAEYFIPWVVYLFS